MKKGFVYAGTTVLIWSTLAAVTKLLLADLPNLQALSVSSLFAFVFLLLLNLKNGSIKKLRSYGCKDYLIMAGLGALGLFAYNVLYFYGLSKLSSQEACILNYLWPMMLVVFSCLILKERLSWIKVLAMVCSFFGIVILSMGKTATAGGSALLGMAGCVIAAACYGLYSVLNKKADYDQNIAMMIGWLVVAVGSAGLGLFTEQWVRIEASGWLGLLWLGVVVNAIAYLLWALALQGTKNTAAVANLAYFTPFLSLVVSAVLLKERITARAVVALVFIVGGVVLQSICKSKKPDSF